MPTRLSAAVSIFSMTLDDTLGALIEPAPAVLVLVVVVVVVVVRAGEGVVAGRLTVRCTTSEASGCEAAPLGARRARAALSAVKSTVFTLTTRPCPVGDH